MRDGDVVIGALNMNSRARRECADEDIAVAVILGDVATSYVFNAAKLHDQERLGERLQQALDSRVVIEQAKGDRGAKEIGHGRSLLPAQARSPPQQPCQCAHGR